MVERAQNRQLNIVRVAIAAGTSAAIFFALCWAGTFLPIGPATHLYLRLFASADTASLGALAQGVGWSLAFGVIAGGLFAGIYNSLARLAGD